MDKQKALKEIDNAIQEQKELLENIEFKADEAKHQAEVRASYFDGQRRSTRDSINMMYQLRAGIDAMEDQ